MLHQTAINADWTQDRRARLILASLAAHPIPSTLKFDTYVLTRDEYSRYEGYRVDCLDAIYTEYWNRVNVTTSDGDWTLFDAFMAQPNPQDAIHAAQNPEHDKPSLWDMMAAEVFPAFRPERRMAA